MLESRVELGRSSAVFQRTWTFLIERKCEDKKEAYDIMLKRG
jgi:hypothetical protein